MRLSLRTLTTLALLAFTAPSLRAQDRQLHWSLLDVEARLDRDGRLHVRERHDMVFSGDWNGGERIFNIGADQDLTLTRLARIDRTTGQEVEMQDGDLDQVDGYRLDGTTLRWRARLPSDPPFDSTALSYVIEYTIDGALLPSSDRYNLNHDFAFPDRAGIIERFTARLALDEPWRAPPGFRTEWREEMLWPGTSRPFDVNLEYAAEGRPSGVVLGASATVRVAIVGAMALAFVGLLLACIRRERALGRFAPLAPASTVTEAWLAEHLLTMLPEEAGTAFDDTTSAPEVAAMIARMVAEKKLETQVKTTGKGILTVHELTMRLLVPVERLEGHEAALIASLFAAGKQSTSSSEIRARYKKTGFDPASVIKGTLQLRVKALPGGSGGGSTPSKVPTIVLLALAGALLGLAVAERSRDVEAMIPYIFATMGGYIVIASQSGVWRNRVANVAPHMLRFIVPGAIGFALLARIILDTANRHHPLIFAAMAMLAIALWNSALNLGKSRQSPERLALRRRLTTIRNFFRDELRKPEPALRDEWYPYFLAFGLGAQVDKWFRAFGGEAVRRTVTQYSSGMSPSRSGGSGSAPSFGGFGGGGGFAGGGSSGSWGSAISSFAAGVSAPSSSSSGGSRSGGGGGGSRSGGGGGGGW